jgi:hypothetical protein
MPTSTNTGRDEQDTNHTLSSSVREFLAELTTEDSEPSIPSTATLGGTYKKPPVKPDEVTVNIASQILDTYFSDTALPIDDPPEWLNILQVTIEDAHIDEHPGEFHHASTRRNGPNPRNRKRFVHLHLVPDGSNDPNALFVLCEQATSDERAVNVFDRPVDTSATETSYITINWAANSTQDIPYGVTFPEQN